MKKIIIMLACASSIYAVAMENKLNIKKNEKRMNVCKEESNESDGKIKSLKFAFSSLLDMHPDKDGENYSSFTTYLEYDREFPSLSSQQICRSIFETGTTILKSGNKEN